MSVTEVGRIQGGRWAGYQGGVCVKILNLDLCRGSAFLCYRVAKQLPGEGGLHHA